MFDSQTEALAFRDDLVQILDAVDTDGWLVSPRLDGAHIQLGANAGTVRGTFDGQGYHTTTIDPDPGWQSALKVEPA